ncbi:GNAT family N-acetyltransferase [Aliiroseovarius sp. YM-037]|uniref:GNAT family N-acetyltransferase n=1 Tax=Aliiroseovarius sp. YM-037 TaxID=3341728 RepID=UPI003A808B89
MRYETIVTQPVIEANRFILRPVRRSDAGLLEMYASDKRVAEATSSIPHPLPPGTTDAFIARALDEERTEDVWIMDGTELGHSEVLGVIGLDRMERAQSEVGYWVAPAFWNTGLASEAVEALLRANPQNCETIFAQVFQDNPASARVLTKAGFEYLGDAETHSVARGANVATWTYLRKLSA